MTAQIPLEPVESVAITILVDNVVDVFMPDQGPARRFAPEPQKRPRQRAPLLEAGEVGQQLRAEHGFSALVASVRDGRSHNVLFDAGVSPDGLVENMRCLGIVAEEIEVVVLSHGHPDHTTGLDGFVRTVGRANAPVIIHPELWTQRRIRLPGREPWELPSLSRSAIEAAGFDIVERRQPSLLLDSSILVTGEIDRTNDVEKGFPVQEAFRGGKWHPDPLVLDEQALVLHVQERGLVIVTGCGHAGIVNTVDHARRLTGIDRVYAVIGGFHLNGPLFEPLIPYVCNAFSRFSPDVIVPTHCTGWRATHAFAAAFPKAFTPSCVGTRFEL